MESRKATNVLLLFLLIGVLVFGFLFLKQQKKATEVSNAWPETVPATPTNNFPNQNPNNYNPNPIPNTNTNTNPNPTPTQPQSFVQPAFSAYPSATANFTHATSFQGQQAGLFEWKLGNDFLAKDPNFATYYRVEPVGCGSSCWGLNLIDLRTGIGYPVPDAGQSDFMAMPNSKLYASIHAPDPYLPPTELSAELATKNRDLKVRWYSFNEATKAFTFIKQAYCNRIENVSGVMNLVKECIE